MGNNNKEIKVAGITHHLHNQIHEESNKLSVSKSQFLRDLAVKHFSTSIPNNPEHSKKISLTEWLVIGILFILSIATMVLGVLAYAYFQQVM